MKAEHIALHAQTSKCTSNRTCYRGIACTHTHTCSQLASPCSRLLRLSTYAFSNTTTYEHRNTLETFSLLCIQLARLCVHLQFHPKSRMLGLYEDLFKLSRNRDDDFTIIINIYRNWFCCLSHTRFPCRTQMRI